MRMRKVVIIKIIPKTRTVGFLKKAPINGRAELRSVMAKVTAICTATIPRTFLAKFTWSS